MSNQMKVYEITQYNGQDDRFSIVLVFTRVTLFRKFRYKVPYEKGS